MHSGIWSNFADKLAQHFRVTLVDLPGHGRSLDFLPAGIEDFSDRFLEIVPKGAFGLGWSLGGQLLLSSLCRDPSHFSGGILIASTPKFSQGAGWPGVSHAALAAMLENLRQDYRETLRRFVGLQTLGQVGARELSKTIIEVLESQPPPQSSALEWGLSVLTHADLREQMAELTLPILSILGARDRLIPVQVGSELEKLSPSMQVLVLEDAAHVPFLTHPQAVSDPIVRFIREHQG